MAVELDNPMPESLRELLDEIVRLWDTNEIAPHPQADVQAWNDTFEQLRGVLQDDDELRGHSG